MGLADDAEALANSLGFSNTARAVRDEVATARRIVRENLTDASLGLQEAGTRLQHSLGVGGTVSSAASVCDMCALPFVHGPALQPEIRRMQMELDRCPEEAMLHMARDELKRLDHVLQLVTTAPISPLQELVGATADCAASGAVSAVAELLRREASHETERAKAQATATLRAHSGREAFLRHLAQADAETSSDEAAQYGAPVRQ